MGGKYKNLEKKRATCQRWRQTHKEYQRLWANQYNHNCRLKVLTHYSNGLLRCANCGVADVDVLCVDHVNGGGNQHRKSLGIISGSNFDKWLIRNNYPEGFQVLCWNCNHKKRVEEIRKAMEKKNGKVKIGN